MEKNCLYYGDNLTVLREHIKDESVDLIYLDPPFNTRQDYNVLFAERDGTDRLPALRRRRTFKKVPKSRQVAEEQMQLGGEIEEPFEFRLTARRLTRFPKTGKFSTLRNCQAKNIPLPVTCRQQEK